MKKHLFSFGIISALLFCAHLYTAARGASNTIILSSVHQDGPLKPALSEADSKELLAPRSVSPLILAGATQPHLVDHHGRPYTGRSVHREGHYYMRHPQGVVPDIFLRLTRRD